VSERYDLEVDRLIPADPQTVFDAFFAMYGDRRQEWIVESQLDLRVGGSWSVTFHPPGLDEFREDRRITELTPPRRLGYDMRVHTADGQPGLATVVALSFDAEGPSTEVRLRQRGFPTAENRDEFARAWRQVLEILENDACRSS
jgi:uncharacterized protein YndB with AHSA1/START domain